MTGLYVFACMRAHAVIIHTQFRQLLNYLSAEAFHEHKKQKQENI